MQIVRALPQRRIIFLSLAPFISYSKDIYGQRHLLENVKKLTIEAYPHFSFLLFQLSPRCCQPSFCPQELGVYLASTSLCQKKCVKAAVFICSNGHRITWDNEVPERLRPYVENDS